MERKNREKFSKRTGPLDRRKGWKKRGAVGGTYCVPYRHIHNPRDAISYLRDSDMSIVAVEKNDRSTSLFHCAYPPKPAFVFGDETYGVYQSLFDAADLAVAIPMYGTIQSLNVSISAAIVMYDYLQKRNRDLQIKAVDVPIDLDLRSDFCLVAQSFQKEHNIDTVLRYANAGMAREVVAVGRRDWYERGAVNDAYGVPYKHIRHPNDAIDYLRSNGMSIVVIEKNESSKNLFDCVYPSKSAFVLGNEVYGVYPAFLDAADLVVEIPMYGALRSLNVSVTGAVVMYDYLQKRDKRDN